MNARSATRTTTAEDPPCGRHVVVDSPPRHRRDDHRREELLERTEAKLIALAERVRTKRLVDAAKIGAAVQRILGPSPVSRCFITTIGDGRFNWDYNTEAVDYDQRLLAGRYVLTTSLTTAQASTAEVVAHYQSLANVEHRFRVMKDFLGLRPVFHWTEQRVRGHIAICVLAAVIEAVIANDLTDAGIDDPDLTRRPDHHTPSGARRTQPDSDPSPHRRRPQHQRHFTAQHTPNPALHRARRRHPNLGQSRHHLNPLNHPQILTCRGNTLSSRTPLPGTTQMTR